MQKNVFGEDLIPCSTDPITGYFRDGCCHVDEQNRGAHTVCAVMTDEFLAFSKKMGNDLSSPMALYRFPGLKAGDHWCLVASRWVEAYHAGQAPLVVLEATNEKVLELVPLEILVKFAWKKQPNNEVSNC